MERDSVADAGVATAEELGREFFAAIDARDPRRLRATLANHASFRALPHRELIRPADEIVAYFIFVVVVFVALAVAALFVLRRRTTGASAGAPPRSR